MQHSIHMHTGSTHAAVQHTVTMSCARLQPALRMGCSLFHAQRQPLTRAVAGTLQHKLPGVTLATSKDQRVGVTTFRPVLSAPLPPPPPPPQPPQPPPAPPLGSALATPPKALKPPPQPAAPQPSLPPPQTPPQTPPLSTAEPAGDIEVTLTLP